MFILPSRHTPRISSKIKLLTCLIALGLLSACSRSTTMAPVVAATAISGGDSVQTQASINTPTAIAAPTVTTAITTTVTNNNTNVASGDEVAVLLPTSGQLTDISSAIRAGITDAYQQNTATDKPSMVIDNTNGQTINSLYSKIQQDGATAVIGPLEKNNVEALANQPINTFTLALNQVPLQNPPANFYQFALAPQDEAQAVADKAWFQGYSKPLIIAPDTTWGQTAVNAFSTQWQKDGGKNIANIIYHLPGDPSSSIKANVGVSSPNKQADVIILIANPTQAYQIAPILRSQVKNTPIYATSVIYSGTPDAKANQALNGISFVDMPVLIGNNPNLANVSASLQQWKMQHPNGLVRLYAFGYDAYQLSTQQTALTRPGFSYQGATGTLYVDNQQQVHRKLAWGVFENGLVVPAA